MRDFKLFLVFLTIVMAVAVALLFAVRQFSLAITTVDVIEVEPRVRCARMVTADGAAISCWEVENE